MVYQENALLREELEIKDERFQRISPHRRPHYSPTQRLRILNLRAARRWSMAQTAQAFQVSILTIINWMRRLDEEGENALLQIQNPVNRFPDFVRMIVRHLKSFFPGLGKEKVAQVLARAGLHLGLTTVERMLQEKPTIGPGIELSPHDGSEPQAIRVVTARYPGHVYHLDLTTVPTSAGFWTAWWPFTLPQAWPFAWWIAVVIDHFSRRVMGFAVFKGKPDSHEVRSFMSRAFHKTGKVPKHIILDRDKIFDCHGFKEWCRERKIYPRFGAVGKHGSIAIIERFFRSLKSDGTRKSKIPLRLNAMRQEIASYIGWYNQHRPHSGLQGRTPDEVYEGKRPANRNPRYEPRSRWPRGSPCAAPQTKIKGKTGTKLVLEIGFYEGRKHLPVIELKRVA
jgi:transposase InsO family protein